VAKASATRGNARSFMAAFSVHCGSRFSGDGTG
jgi:hypothetical protein